ncbi:MAG: methyltransferase domain-containing protein [Microthrixaceae bacterium]
MNESMRQMGSGQTGSTPCSIPVSGHPGSIQGGFAAAVPLGRVGVERYDRELVGFLKALVQPHGPTLELGAATGILTGQLARARVDVFATEGEESSLSQLRRSLPHVPAVCADVAAIPLRDSSVGSVLFAGQGSVTSAASLSGRFTGGHLGEGSASACGNLTGLVDSIGLVDERKLVDEGELVRVLRSGGLLVALSRVGPPDVREARTHELPVVHGEFRPVESRLLDDMVVQVWRVGPDV